MSKDKEIEQLIQDALQEGEVKPLPDIERFIDYIKLEASETEWVLGQAVYWFYLNWFHDNDIPGKPVYRDEFFKLAMQSFRKKYQGNDGHFYGLKPEKFALTKDEYRKMKGHLRDQREEQKRVKKWQATRKRKLKEAKQKIQDLKKSSIPK